MKQVQSSPVTPMNSSSSSASDPSAPWPLSEELDSGTNHAYYAGKKEIFSELFENSTCCTILRIWSLSIVIRNKITFCAK